MLNYVYLGAAIIAEVIATSSMRVSDGFTRLWPTMIAAVGYGISLYLLSLTLRVIPVGVAYAIWSGVGIVLISLIAFVLYGQRLDAAAMAGMGLIIAGVMVINLFSKSSAH